MLLLSFIRFVVSFSFFFSRCWDFLYIQYVCACVRVLLQSFSRFFLSIRDFLFIFNFIFGRFDAFFSFLLLYIFLLPSLLLLLLFLVGRWCESKQRMVKIKSSLKIVENESTHSTQRESNAPEETQKTIFFFFKFYFSVLFRLLLVRRCLFFFLLRFQFGFLNDELVSTHGTVQHIEKKNNWKIAERWCVKEKERVTVSLLGLYVPRDVLCVSVWVALLVVFKNKIL